MDDLIPALIVIGISIIGAVSRKKKKKTFMNQPIGNQQQRTSNDDGVFDWLEKLNIDDDPYEEKIATTDTDFFSKEDETVTVEEKTEEKEVYKNPYENYSGYITPKEKEELMAKEGISSIPQQAETKKEITVQAKPKKKNKYLVGFSLKKAIVYNTVMNRKY